MSNALMAPRKNRRSEASRTIAQAIIDQYQPTSAEDIYGFEISHETIS